MHNIYMKENSNNYLCFIFLHLLMDMQLLPLTNDIASISCLLEIFFGILLLVDLGFDRETLIVQIRYLSDLIGYKYSPPDRKLRSIVIFPKL